MGSARHASLSGVARESASTDCTFAQLTVWGRSYEKPPFLILHDKSRARSWQDNLHQPLRRDPGIRNFPVAMGLSAAGSTRSHEITLVPLDVLAQRLRALRSEMPGTDISESWQTPLTVQCCNWDVFVPGMSAGLDTGLVDALNRIECLKGEHRRRPDEGGWRACMPGPLPDANRMCFRIGDAGDYGEAGNVCSSLLERSRRARPRPSAVFWRGCAASRQRRVIAVLNTTAIAMVHDIGARYVPSRGGPAHRRPRRHPRDRAFA